MLHERHLHAMNTDVGVWVWSADPARGPIVRSRLAWAQDYVRSVEAELSRFRETSALSRLNAAAGREPQPVSPLLWAVVLSAIDAAHDSGGIYDPTVLRCLEGVGYDRSFDAVATHLNVDVASPLATFGSWERVGLDDAAGTIELPAGVGLDLGGIAKGWTVDHVAHALAPLGPVLVDAGGDLRVVGTVDDEPWPIGVQDAFVPERDCAIVPLRDGALAPSSVGGRRWQRGGRTLHHVIDPRTGTSSDSDLHAVTVHAPTAVAAEIAAKVVLILGREAGSTFLVDRHLAALLTRRDGHQQVVGDFPSEQVDSNVTFHCA